MNIKHTAILLAGLSLCINFLTIDVFAQNKISKQKIIPSLNGKWKLDLKLSNLGLMPAKNAFDRIEITKVKDSITIVRRSAEIVESGLTATIQTLPLNGNPSKYRSDIMKRTKVSAITLSNDEHSVVETATFNYDEEPLEEHQVGYIETWVISSDGQMLTIERKMKMTNEKSNWATTCVYGKEK